jgi:hypothetical protein
LEQEVQGILGKIIVKETAVLTLLLLPIPRQVEAVVVMAVLSE